MFAVRRTVLRGASAALASGALILTAGAGAWAHECFNASRSDQGNAMAGTHSAAWETVSLETVVTVFLGQGSGVWACVQPQAEAAGIPSSFVFGAKQAVGQGGVIAENNPNMSAGLGSNGKGIDHAEDAYGEALVGLILQCGGSLG
ncbi:MAG TPA: hypothetical protein VFI30_07065 [Nocardioidaceae bacterium]|nr:hypothetical protein [Nocardioidaceae bacterium]